LEAIASGPGNVTLRFEAKADRSYSLLKAATPDSGFWFSLTNIPAASSNRVITVPQAASGMQYFRITTPAQP